MGGGGDVQSRGCSIQGVFNPGGVQSRGCSIQGAFNPGGSTERV